MRLVLLVAVTLVGCSHSDPTSPEFPCSDIAAAYGTPTDSTGMGTAFTLTFSDGSSETFSWATGSCVVTAN